MKLDWKTHEIVMSKHRVAIIEDNDALATMYELKLRLEGYDVRRAANGLEGLEVTEQFRPHLILLDLRMPVMSGDVMLERLRRQEWGADIHAIILTNISKDEAPMSLRFLAVDRYIVKAHHTPKQVVDIVGELLGQN